MFDKWRTKNNRTISEKRFEAIARIEARKCNRIESFAVDGYTVTGAIRSNSGISTWQFSISYDQGGEVTGAYHLWSENDDSSIPQDLAIGMSNAIRAYLSESDGRPDKIAPETPLDLAIEIEMARQDGVSIRQRAEEEAHLIRETAHKDAKDIRSEARKFYEQTVSSASAEAKEMRFSAQAYYNCTVASAREDAESIRAQAKAEAREIKRDAARIAEERREIRVRRRAFVASHKKLFASMFLGLILAIALAAALVRLNAHVKLQSKLIPVGIDSTNCVGAPYREIKTQLSVAGFTNISCVAMADLGAESLSQEETTRFVTIDGVANFASTDRFPYDAKVEVNYLTARKLHAPLSPQDAVGMDVHAVEESFIVAGFSNVRTEAEKDVIVDFKEQRDAVVSVTVDGNDGYSRSDALRPDAEIVIRYHDFVWAD